MKNVTIIIFTFFLSSCASVNSHGVYEVKWNESFARATNAVGGAAIGLAAGLVAGKPVEGAAAGALMGAMRDPNECSEGSVTSESASAPIAGADSGAITGPWKGIAHREHNKRCGNRR